MTISDFISVTISDFISVTGIEDISPPSQQLSSACTLIAYIANNMDPEQTAPKIKVFWLYRVKPLPAIRKKLSSASSTAYVI